MSYLTESQVNPSGFIQPSQTGIFVTTGQTGAFGGSTPTGNLTGAFYPLVSNPSGYITSGRFSDITDVTGTHRVGIVQTNPQFVLDVNGTIGNSAGNIPSSYIDLSNTYLRDGSNIISLIWHGRTLRDTSQNVSLDWGGRTLSGTWAAQALGLSGSSVVLASQTGAFYTNNNPSGFITGLSLNTGSGIGFRQQYCALQYNQNSGVSTINWNNGNVQYFQLTGSSETLTFNNPISGGRYILILKQPGVGGGTTVTWPGTVLWSAGTAPTLTVTNSKVDLVSFIYDGINVKYYGNSSLNF